MEMKKSLVPLIILFMTVGSSPSASMPAYPHRIPVFLGDSVIYIRLYGDEHNKRAESLDGYTLIQKDHVWHYAEIDDSGYLRPSPYRLSVNPDSSTLRFKNDTPLHLLPAKKSTSTNARSRRNKEIQKISAVGQRRILVILMQFSDVSFTKDQDDFHRLFNEENYKEDGAYGSVYDYYKDVSYGKLQLTCNIMGPFTSQYERSYYGKNDRNGNDKNPGALFEEAMEYASLYVNLKDYDGDDDGYIDNVHIIFAGHGEEAGASSDAIWSHESTYYEPFIYQGMLVDRYSCAPELRGNTGTGISRIGPHCHEIGHALGAMDYYDTNYESRGGFEGTGVWDIMAAGSWNADGVIPADFNPYVKMMNFGWVDIEEMPKGQVVISPSLDSENNYYRLSNSPTDYYLVENRSSERWGEALPGAGLMLYHIHPNIENVGNEINATYPQKCYPVCASSNYSIPNSSSVSYGNINSSGCPYPGETGNQEFNMASTPASFSWDEETSNIDLRDITISSNGIISLLNQTNVEMPINDEVLVNEDFEKLHSIITEIEAGDSKWKWVREDGAEKEKKGFEPHGGSGYLRFLPGKLSEGEQQCSYIFDTPEMIAENCASLSFFYQGVSYRTGIHVMNVSYSCDGGEWEIVSIIGNSNPDWKNYSLNLPKAKSYKIKFTGFASYGQAICLDDITVIKKTTVGMQPLKWDVNEEVRGEGDQIYDIIGRAQNNCQKGLNIIRLSDGTFKKIIVK